MAKKSPFPTTIHVTLEGAGENEYLSVSRPDGEFDDIEWTKPVALYQLVSVGRVTVTKVFEGAEGKTKKDQLRNHR